MTGKVLDGAVMVRLARAVAAGEMTADEAVAAAEDASMPVEEWRRRQPGREVRTFPRSER